MKHQIFILKSLVYEQWEDEEAFSTGKITPVPKL